MKKVIAFIILAFLVFSGCDITQLAPTAPDFEEDFGLKLNLNISDLKTKTIAPADLEVGRFEITLTDSELNSISETIITDTNASYYNNRLDPGVWTVVVQAYSEQTSGYLVASASDTFDIFLNETTTLNLDVLLLPGNGTLALDIDWPTGTIDNPRIYATLTPYGGNPLDNIISGDFTLAVDNLSFTYSSATLSAGYYTLNILLQDGDFNVWGLAEAVRIIQDDISSGDWTLIADDINVVDLQLNLNIDLENPFDITLSPDIVILDKSVPESMNVDLGVVTGATSYQWYLNGLEVSGTQGATSIVINSSTLVIGIHRLDALVVSGNILSSNTVSFSVIE